MPRQSRHVCPYPGCPAKTFDDYCPKHTGGGRRSSVERGYDGAWTKCRNAYVRQHPVCEIRQKCNGDAVAEVDHIKPLEDGGDKLDWDNLQSACKPCHTWKTNTIDYPGSA